MVLNCEKGHCCLKVVRLEARYLHHLLWVMRLILKVSRRDSRAIILMHLGRHPSELFNQVCMLLEHLFCLKDVKRVLFKNFDSEVARFIFKLLV
jgi:hypothetical protein